MWQMGGINICLTAAITQPNTALALDVLYISCYVLTTAAYNFHSLPTFIYTDVPCKRSFSTYNKGSCYVHGQGQALDFPLIQLIGRRWGRLTERRKR